MPGTQGMWKYISEQKTNFYPQQILYSRRTYRQLTCKQMHFNHLFYLVLIFISAVLGLHCCGGAFAGCSNWRLLFFVVHGLLIAVASLVTEHGLWIHGLQQSQHEASVVVLHGLSCFAACGMFPNEGSNTCPLHW